MSCRADQLGYSYPQIHSIRDCIAGSSCTGRLCGNLGLCPSESPLYTSPSINSIASCILCKWLPRKARSLGPSSHIRPSEKARTEPGTSSIPPLESQKYIRPREIASDSCCQPWYCTQENISGTFLQFGWNSGKEEPQESIHLLHPDSIDSHKQDTYQPDQPSHSWEESAWPKCTPKLKKTTRIPGCSQHIVHLSHCS